MGPDELHKWFASDDPTSKRFWIVEEDELFYLDFNLPLDIEIGLDMGHPACWAGLVGYVESKKADYYTSEADD